MGTTDAGMELAHPRTEALTESSIGLVGVV
jgi:hypothetical protein